MGAPQWPCSPYKGWGNGRNMHPPFIIPDIFRQVILCGVWDVRLKSLLKNNKTKQTSPLILNISTVSHKSTQIGSWDHMFPFFGNQKLTKIYFLLQEDNCVIQWAHTGAQWCSILYPVVLHFFTALGIVTVWLTVCVSSARVWWKFLVKQSLNTDLSFSCLPVTHEITAVYACTELSS